MKKKKNKNSDHLAIIDSMTDPAQRAESVENDQTYTVTTLKLRQNSNCDKTQNVTNYSCDKT